MPLGNPIRKQNESRIISVLATEGQSVFTVEGGYIINQISVFRNGVRLSNSEDFTAGDGSTVTLNNEANVDDRIEFHIFDKFTVQNAIVGAASTQTISGDLVVNGKLFGNLDVPSINTGIITASGNINANGNIVGDDSTNISGISSVTATSFFGGLTGNVTGNVTGNADTATVATNVTVTDESSDTTCHPLFATTNTGNAAVKVGSNLSFNSANGTLTATSFSGSGANLTDLVSDKIFEGNTEVETVDTGSDGHVKVTTEGTERLRIDSSGRLLFGITSSISGIPIQIASSYIQQYVAGNDANPGHLDILKTRNASASGNTILQDGDKIGDIRFRGNTGSGYVNGAFIRAEVNGTPGSGNDLPTDLEFHTMPDGSGSTNERLRITSSGAVQVNGGAVHLDASGELAVFETDTNLAFTNSAKLSFDFSSNVARIRTSGNGSFSARPLAIYTTNTEVLRVDTNAKVLIGTATASSVGNSAYSKFEVSGNTSGSTGPAHVSIKKGETTASLSSGDTLGRLLFSSLDGGDFAYIQASVDATPGTSDFPGRLMFFTCADDASSATERFRITNDGKFGFNKTDPANDLVLKTTAAHTSMMIMSASESTKLSLQTVQDSDVRIGTASNHPLTIYSNSLERMRITTAGTFGFNKTDPEGKGIDVTHSRSNSYSATTDTRNLAHIIARNSSDASGRFASISMISGAGTQAEGSLNLIQTGNYTGDLAIKIRTAVSSWGEKARFLSSGGITFNGDTAAANALDDYEEGSWTPVVLDGNGSNYSISPDTNNTYYRKIGSQVTVYYVITNNESGSKTGFLYFATSSLPYAIARSAPASGGFWVDHGGPTAGAGDIIGGVHNAGTGGVYFTKPTDTTGMGAASSRYLMHGQWTNNRPIYGQFSYVTN